MSKLLSTLIAVAFAAVSAGAIAQGTAPSSGDAMKTDKSQPKKQIKESEKQKALEAKTSTAASESKSSASGAAATGGAMQPPKAAKTTKTKEEKKKDFAAGQAAAQKESMSSASGAPATTDKDKAKLTKDERKAAAKDVGKGSTGN